ncbi:MAG: hypothetical protein ABFD89_06795 [Bryobacteraceae bacterium]
MKERPILMCGPMVLATLKDQKTNTRRVLKPQPPSSESIYAKCGQGISLFNDEWSPDGATFRVGGACGLVHDACGQDSWRCPYGEPGDRLWVKETWKPHCEGPISAEFPLGTCVKYRADGVCVKPDTWDNEQGAWCEAHEESTKWRPSIFMPRWASRITLEVTGVKAQQVQDISEGDAASEGIQFISPDWKKNPVGIFAVLWDSINLKRGFGWDANPWVWVVQFKRV